MISHANKIVTIKKLVKCDCPTKYAIRDDGEGYNIIISPRPDTIITIIDDSVSELMPSLFVIFDSSIALNSLTFIVESGKYHEDGIIFGEDLIENEDQIYDGDWNRVFFYCDNKINRLIVKQKICTENIYSYLGNQDGFSARTINVDYNPQKYESVQFSGNLKISSQQAEDISGNKYKLGISI